MLRKLTSDIGREEGVVRKLASLQTLSSKHKGYKFPNIVWYNIGLFNLDVLVEGM